LRIALAILNADPRRGGAERYTVDLARGLTRRGHQVSIVATNFPVMFSDITSVHLPANGMTRTGLYKNFLDLFDHHIHLAPYDIVHAMLPFRRCDVYHPHAGLAIEKMSADQNRGIVQRTVSMLLNRVNPRRRAFAKVEQRLLARPRSHRPIVLCLSDYVKQSVKQFYPLDDDHLATLFNAVELQKFDPAARPTAGQELRDKYKLPANATVAVMIAQDFARKGLAEALRALAIAGAAGKHIKLLVVGSGDVTFYQRLATRSGVGSQVIFAGHTDDVYAAYQAADFFVLPTRHDPCSLVVLEALAMGVPVISTKQNGATEIMADGVHGYVLPSHRDIPGLARAMQNLADPATRQSMSDACLALRPRLSFETHLDELLKVYDRAPGHWS